MFLFSLAILPPLLIALYIYKQDKYEKEPRKLIISSFLFGCLSIIPVIILELIAENTLSGLGLFISVFIGVALIEEGAKYFFLKKYLFPKNDFNEPFDGIVYAVMISLGFATVENIGYVYQNLEAGFQVAILRMFTAIPLHASCGIIMGYFVGSAKFSTKNRSNLLFKGVFYATLLHGVYDYFLFLPEQNNQLAALSILSIVALIIGIVYAKKGMKIHQENSPFK